MSVGVRQSACNWVASPIAGVPPVGLSSDGGHGGVYQKDGEMQPAKTNHIKS